MTGSALDVAAPQALPQEALTHDDDIDGASMIHPCVHSGERPFAGAVELAAKVKRKPCPKSP
jgi:hypothetical protein